jgi:hypothetical protein
MTSEELELLRNFLKYLMQNNLSDEIWVNIIDVLGCTPKKEIVIDKVGKWMCRNGEIKNIINLTGGELQPIQSDCGNYWSRNGDFYMNIEESPYDLIEFISPPEFTEEGLYEMANGETVNLEYDHCDMVHVLYERERGRRWSKTGERYPIGDKEEENRTQLIRYLGKKPFEINKPGIYEDDKKERVIFHKVTPFYEDLLVGFKFHNSGMIIQSFYRKDGKCNIPNFPTIVKFISPTWNFEKGEPV